MPCPRPDGLSLLAGGSPEFELRMPNRIGAVAAAVERMLAACGLAPAAGEGGDMAPRSPCMALSEVGDALRLALTEALNNVIEHGAGPAVSPAILLRLWRGGRTLTICIEDRGPPPNAALARARRDVAPPRLRREPAPARLGCDPSLARLGRDPADGIDACDLEALPEGGWGLMLIDASVDRVRRQRTGDRNRLFLQKVLPPCACAC